MALFVHLAPEKNAPAIRRAGIRTRRRGVYCLPVLPSYVLTHQWVRELRRRGQGPIVAVDFRIPDDEPVTVGHYNGPPQEVTAAQAITVIREHEDPRGYEVVIPRPITRRELVRVRQVNQGIGWRYKPGAHGQAPCACEACLRKGVFKAADIRARFGDTPRRTKPELMEQLAEAFDEDDTYSLRDALFRLGRRSRGDAADLVYLLDHWDPYVRKALAKALGAYRDRAAVDMLQQLAADTEPMVREAVEQSLLKSRKYAPLRTPNAAPEPMRATDSEAKLMP